MREMEVEVQGRQEGNGKQNEKRKEIRGRARPGESEVTVFIIAPDPLHRSGLSRAVPFNWEVNLRNQASDETIKKGISVSCHCRGT